MIRFPVTIAGVLLLSLACMAAANGWFVIGAEIDAGTGKTRDRTFVQPWNFSGSSQLAFEWRLSPGCALMVRGGYAYFNDDPVVISMIREESFKAELTVHEATVTLSQIMRPLDFFHLEHGLVLAFPFHTRYDEYLSTLSSDGWSGYEHFSTKNLHRSFYASYPLAALVYGLGFDVSRLWHGRAPLTLFIRQEFGITDMYLGADAFAAVGREQDRISWGLRSMLVSGGRPPASPSSGGKHALELSFGLGTGSGNLRSVKEDPRFSQEATALASIGAAYVHDEKFRLGLELGNQFRQYTESEFTYATPVSFRKDYFHHYLNYFSACFWFDAFPVRYVVSGAGIGLYWLLPFGNSGWRYAEADSLGTLARERVSRPHEYYDRSFDPALLFKLGTPLYRYTGVPLEVDLIGQWGLRQPKIDVGFYRRTRPVFAAISLKVSYMIDLKRN